MEWEGDEGRGRQARREGNMLDVGTEVVPDP